MGFVIESDDAHRWIEQDARNAEVLFPYLNGEDLNSRASTSASRWVIDFTGRDEVQSAEYPTPFARLVETVKSERLGKPKLVSSAPWWQFFNIRPTLRRAMLGLDEVLTIALVSKTVLPVRVPAGQVFSHMLAVFATGSFAQQAILSSSLHQVWAITHGSTLETRVRYAPSDVFETFPRPAETSVLQAIGRTLDTERREIMLRRNLGLTKLYNLVNDEAVASASDPDVARLREIHEQLDHAVMTAYGWDDVPLNHGFHTYRQMTRWTVCPEARVEILDRLLEENHRRAALQGEPIAVGEDDAYGE
jgi:hypothetical protein